MRKTLLSALIVIVLTAQFAGCNGNTPIEQPNESSSVVSDVSEPQNSTSSSTETSSSSKPQSSTVSTTSSTSETNEPQSSSTETTTSVPEVSEPQSSTASTTSGDPEISSSESNSQSEETSKDDTPKWTETAVSGERYVNTDYISSRANAIQGSTTVKQYRLNDKVTVVAKTDTNYYKLEDGTFIHADYLSESKVTVQTPTQSTTTSGGQEEIFGAEHLNFIELDDGTLAVEAKIENHTLGAGRNEFINVVIPEEYNGKKVTRIAERGFLQLRKLKSITIPEGIVEIGKSAFNACESLETVNLPQSLKTIGSSAFSMCKNLKSITIYNGVEMIERNAFDSTAFLSNQKGIRYLGNWVIGCEEGTTIAEIKNGTIGIAGGAFSGDEWGVNHKFEYISLPDSIKYINSLSFNSCTIENLKIPDCLTALGYGFFDGTSIGNLTMPKTVTYIDPQAMNGGWVGCRRLDNLYYTGTEEEWNNLLQNSGWNGKIVYAPISFGEKVEPTPIEYKIHFNSEGPDIP